MAANIAVSKGIERIHGVNVLEVALSVHNSRDNEELAKYRDIFRILYVYDAKHRVSLHQPLLHFLGMMLQILRLLRVS